MNEGALDAFQEDILRVVTSDTRIPDKAKAWINEAKDDYPLLMSRLLIEALKVSNFNKSEVLIWQGASGALYCRPGNLLDFGFRNRKKTKNLIVVPVDTSLEVHVTRAYEGIAQTKVSEKSLHGQWLTRMMLAGYSEEELARRIREELVRSYPSKEEQARYPIGSIVAIEESSAAYLLVALSDFDEHGRGNSTVADVERVLKAVLEYYDIHGQAADLYLPLIGGGLSRVGLPPQEAFKTICKFVSGAESSIYGKWTIVVRPEVKEDLGLEL